MNPQGSSGLSWRQERWAFIHTSKLVSHWFQTQVLCPCCCIGTEPLYMWALEFKSEPYKQKFIKNKRWAYGNVQRIVKRSGRSINFHNSYMLTFSAYYHLLPRIFISSLFFLPNVLTCSKNPQCCNHSNLSKIWFYCLLFDTFQKFSTTFILKSII